MAIVSLWGNASISFQKVDNMYTQSLPIRNGDKA